MFVRIGLFACAAWALTAFESKAQTIDDNTKCSLVGGIMDAPSPDKRKVYELSNYILHTMQVIDHSYGVRGQVEILPRMSEEGRYGVIASASVRCREHPNTTIRNMAIESYEGVRAIGDTLGVNN